MQIALKKHIDKNLSFLKDKKLLIAISGGIDSVVLTHLVYNLHFSISLAHSNFMLRGAESNKDEQFVINLGETLKVPAFTIKFETQKYAIENGISTQMAARELRYNWFEQLRNQYHLDYILTAHHKEDVIETFLINLTRGTGLDGLTGIPVINGTIVRPLLPFTRNELLVYASKNKIRWQEDQSNSSIKYVRNKIRHKVVPVLKELNPRLLDTFFNTLEHLKGSQQIVNDYVQNIRQKITIVRDTEIHFDIKKLKNLSSAKVYLYELLKEYGFTEWDDVCDLLDAQTGKQVFSSTHRLLKNRDFLILTEFSTIKENKSYQIAENTSKINEPLKLKFETIPISSDTKNHQKKVLSELYFDDINTISIDADSVQFPLTIRKWRKGDYFYPIGLKGKKKLSKFFKDEKLSLLTKENTWILCSNDAIIWIIGKRLDDRFKVTKTTTKILKIKL